MGIVNTLKRIIAGPEQRELPNLGRNEQCHCGSGRKYKSCHLGSDSRKRASARAASSQAASTVAQRGF